MIFEICRFNESRWQEYRDLRLEALREKQTAFGSSHEENLATPEEYWRKRTPNVLFALVDGQVSGMLALGFNKRVKTKHIAEIFGVYIKKAFRRFGIGNRLLESAFAEAREHCGIVKIRLWVNPSQTVTVRLYRGLGFKTIDRLKKEIFVDGQFYDEIVMEKFMD